MSNSAAEPVYVTSGLVRLTRPQLIGTMIGLLLAALLAAIDQTIVGTAEPRIIASLHGIRPLPVGRDDLPAHVHPVGPDLREPVGHLRPQAVLHARRDPVRRLVRAVRRGRRIHVPADRRHGPADPLPRTAGRRRRHGHRHPLHDRRRHLFADRARKLPGPLLPRCGASRRSSVRRSAAG